MKCRGNRSIVLVLLLIACAGCHRSAPPTSTASLPVVYAPSLSPFRNVAQADTFPRDLSREEVRNRIIGRFRDRILSHRDVNEEAERMVREIAPIIEAAVQQPEAQDGLQQFADDSNIRLEEARKRWAALQEADLMLESGGDPDSLSTSYAAGVAQWLAGTAQGVGLRVNRKESDRLTARITALRCRVAWIEYLRRPDADHAAPGAPAFSPADISLLPELHSQLENLRAQRRSVDERYEPRAAIFAQTRYLLRLYPRFPSPDWLFQAYHGGEAGVRKTLHLYEGKGWPGDAAAAIRSGDNGGPLSFETVYFTCSPQSHAEAFSYLYSRSDDHRHYWWKLRAAQEVLSLYRKSSDDFRKKWEASSPGRRIEALWYPDASVESLPDLPALQSAVGQKKLIAVQETPEIAVRAAPDDLANARWYQALKPEAKGALLLAAAVYHQKGGKGRLEVGDLTLTQNYVTQAKRLHPPKPLPPPIFPPDPDAQVILGGGPPRSFDYHTTGLVFDILRPKNQQDRKILEYALDTLMDRQILDVLEAKDLNERRYHIVPHPQYAHLFTRIAQSGVAPRTF